MYDFIKKEANDKLKILIKMMYSLLDNINLF